MAINRKGLRVINVEGQEYLWRFGRDILSVFQEYPFGEISVEYGYIPSVDDMGDYNRQSRTDFFEARSITPSFIHDVILFAKSQNWEKGKLGPTYQDSEFKVTAL